MTDRATITHWTQRTFVTIRGAMRSICMIMDTSTITVIKFKSMKTYRRHDLPSEHNTQNTSVKPSTLKPYSYYIRHNTYNTSSAPKS